MQPNITYSDTFRHLPIQADRQRELGCRREILKRLYDIFQHTIKKHNKVLFIRFDVTFPDDRTYPEDNTLFEGFLANLIKNLKRKTVKRGSLDPYYLWVREAEYENTPNHHYHCILLLDANKTHKIHNHLAKAEELWNRALGLPYTDRSGLIDYCVKDRYGNPQENGIMLLREDSDFQYQLIRCYHWASYLAKVNTKGNVASSVREMGSSQLPLYRYHRR